jgi:hypothetical protein
MDMPALSTIIILHSFFLMDIFYIIGLQPRLVHMEVWFASEDLNEPSDCDPEDDELTVILRMMDELIC